MFDKTNLIIIHYSLSFGESMEKYEIDAPIKNSENDKLNRSKFVEILYNSIIHYGKHEKKCLVIGLMGEWGCGKTSIINMVYEKIGNVVKLIFLF